MNLVFFTDRDRGKRFPEILASAGLSVKRHDDLFPRDAVIRHRVSLLVVVGKAPLKELAENFIATMPRITEFLARHRAPLIAKVYRPTPAERMEQSDAPGSVALWYPK